jgi:uncharacterized protein YndB with AHSA1/START domain
MTEVSPNGASTADIPDLVIARILDAPRDVVFSAWVDCTHVLQWWGPALFTNSDCRIEPWPGGAFRITMHAPDGNLYPGRGTFREVTPPERFVLVSTALDDEHGRPGLEVLQTVTFEEHAGQTRLTMRAHVLRATPAAAGALAGMEPGWNQSLDRLAGYLKTRQ